VSDDTRKAEKILVSRKGLRDHMQPGEQPLVDIPAIWHGGEGRRGMPCDVILTNQRLLGYAFVTFPRERLFLEAMPLAAITTVSLRQKTYEPIFHELLVSDGQRHVYIRAPRKQIETLYTSLRAAIEEHVSSAAENIAQNESPSSTRPTPIYSRQVIRTSFERSPLAITLLFVGGICLEIIGALLWSTSQNTQVGLPLCTAGFVAVLTAILIRKQ
jgi:hypothetical protein